MMMMIGRLTSQAFTCSFSQSSLILANAVTFCRYTRSAPGNTGTHPMKQETVGWECDFKGDLLYHQV